jgi:regulator of protease activity HflC (stomatin/prohibitin superfamily)
VNKSDSNTPNSGVILGLLKGILFLSFLAITLAFIFGVSIPPGSIGLRQITFSIPFGPKQGFLEKGMEPGLHWSIPVYSKVHVIPQSIQVVDVNREVSGALEVQTTDGSSVLVDVSMLTRYYNDSGETEIGGKKISHGGPADLIQKLGASQSQWDNTVRRVAIDELRRALGRLSTSEFYNPQKRELAAVEARDNMNEKLGKFGVGVIGAYIRRYTYSEDRIDLAIFAKNLQDQEERLNAAASKLAEAKAKSEQVSAEWDAKIQTLTVEGENRSKVIRSEGDLYQAEKVAEGDLVVAQAKAEVDKLKATVLAGTPGAEVYVAREMAPLVSALKGGVVTEVDPFDVDQWVKKLGVNGK